MITYFRNVWLGFWTVLVGMRETFVHLFQPSVTLQYPAEKWELPVGARAILFNNIDDCIGCDKCARACPVDCIAIETVKAGADEDLGETSTGNKKRLHVVRFDIDMAQCCYCGLCTYPCPTECLVMTPEYENSVFSRDNLIYHFSKYSAADVTQIKERAKKAEADRLAAKAKKATPKPAAQEAAS